MAKKRAPAASTARRRTTASAKTVPTRACSTAKEQFSIGKHEISFKPTQRHRGGPGSKSAMEIEEMLKKKEESPVDQPTRFTPVPKPEAENPLQASLRAAVVKRDEEQKEKRAQREHEERKMAAEKLQKEREAAEKRKAEAEAYERKINEESMKTGEVCVTREKPCYIVVISPGGKEFPLAQYGGKKYWSVSEANEGVAAAIAQRGPGENIRPMNVNEYNARKSRG